MELTPKLCRAARALLGWAPEHLAQAAQLSIGTVHRFEAGGVVRPSSSAAMMDALESAGIDFIPEGGSSLAGGAGVRSKPGPVDEPEVAVAEVLAEAEEEVWEPVPEP